MLKSPGGCMIILQDFVMDMNIRKYVYKNVQVIQPNPICVICIKRGIKRNIYYWHC